MMSSSTIHSMPGAQERVSVGNGDTESSVWELYARADKFHTNHQLEEALHYYQKALEVDPHLAGAHYNMGVIYNERYMQAKATAHFEEALRIQPDLAEAYNALAMMRCSQHKYEEALVLLEQALAIRTDYGDAYYNMGLVLHQLGEFTEGVRSFQKALTCKPTHAPARWRYLLSLPVIYETQDQIKKFRRRFIRGLEDLEHSIKLETPLQIQHAVQGIGTATNFYLQYQGLNDLELQQRYGRLVCNVMWARYPQWKRPPSMQPPTPGTKIKIGYVSSFMFHHTVGTFLAGWLENHDQSEFEVYCYHIGLETDALTAHLKKFCHRFVHLPGHVEAMADRIRSDNLHVLVYNDIGMNVETLQLAALRLAPVQCKGWGHPVTTGLPTIDYYLSSDLMEPEDAEKHYSEKLVRLPNLALCYRSPQLPTFPKTRTALGLPENRFAFLSTQSVFKYLPHYDDLYALIASEAPQSCFVFLRHQSRQINHRFHRRLGKAFARHGLDIDRYCYFIPRLNSDDFLSLNMAADVLLDTLDWSGGKTTLEAISCGLPVLTCPGRFMRGRHAYAMLKMMGIDETIARDVPEYCRIAARLANENGFYSQIKSRLISNRYKLFDDSSFMRVLEDHYRSFAGGPSTDASNGLTNIPGDSHACFQNGLNHLKLGRPDLASIAIQDAIRLMPTKARYWFHLGECQLIQNDIGSAIASYQQAVELKPDWEAAHYNYAVVLQMADRTKDAITHAKQALAINPGYVKALPLLFRLAQHACDWKLVDEISKRLEEATDREIELGLRTTEPPLTNIRRISDPRTNLKVARSWSLNYAREVRPINSSMCFTYQKPKERLRIGYLSSDFKDHAVAFQIRGMFDQHDRSRFEIYGYACNPDDGTRYRHRMAAACDHFRDVHKMDDRSLAHQINSDGIHILVDMAGHSKANRMRVTAMRPAPVQVSYLGFLSTTGADFIDYVLADKVVVPKEHARFYSEKVVYLPYCYQANDDEMSISAVPQNRRQWNLPEDAFVFCSFNQPYKIDADLFASWLRIIKRVDGSVLWLVERGELARTQLSKAAENNGVDPSRLIFTGFVPMEQNLSRLRLADLFLDTLAHNGGATTSNALWAGVPVVTTLGNHWVSRMSASALFAAGLFELVAANRQEYERMAIELALNPNKYRDIRRRLANRSNTVRLFDTEMFTRWVEDAFNTMWQRYSGGDLPESFEVRG